MDRESFRKKRRTQNGIQFLKKLLSNYIFLEK